MGNWARGHHADAGRDTREARQGGVWTGAGTCDQGESPMTNTTDTAVERGSGNVFADLGLAAPDEHLLKAELVGRIDDIVRERGITGTEAARLLGLSRRDVSRLLRGDFREHSLECLLRGLAALGRDVDIVIREPHSGAGGKLRIAGAEPA